MSENPFQPPVATANPNSHLLTGNATPGALKVLCILCIILGAFGLLGALVGGAALMFQAQIQEAQQTVGDASQQAFQAKIAEMQQQQLIPNLLLTSFNFVIALLLLVGAIGVLARKAFAPKIFGIGLISAAVFVVIRMVVSVFIQMGLVEVMREGFVAQAQGQPQAEVMQTALVTSMYVGFAIGAAWAIGLAIFYFWGWRLMKKDTTQAFLNTFE